eukprot:CAMPEP_0182602828 /NCGR_PEP_ID=MMETSP1324-20130603/92188_1 /TAXON_ID=236786 /ORGANISM="Florenciella sp., Strain RCC1587" /LENGTH=211 /DNA_ID=CAMNT_0024820753 /DNA_START=640 /DNA_END=1273 /DNA_ORIENTATION=+
MAHPDEPRWARLINLPISGMMPALELGQLQRTGVLGPVRLKASVSVPSFALDDREGVLVFDGEPLQLGDTSIELLAIFFDPKGSVLGALLPQAPLIVPVLVQSFPQDARTAPHAREVHLQALEVSRVHRNPLPARACGRDAGLKIAEELDQPLVAHPTLRRAGSWLAARRRACRARLLELLDAHLKEAPPLLRDLDILLYLAKLRHELGSP